MKGRLFLPLFALFLLFIGCTKQVRPSFHAALRQVDSLLQQDSLQWRYMYCHKQLPDCLYMDGKLFTGNIIHVEWNLEARRLFKTKADSLLTLLEEFPMQTLTNEADSAYHALLFTEARIIHRGKRFRPYLRSRNQ